MSNRPTNLDIDEWVKACADTKWDELGRRLKALNESDRRAGTNRAADGLESSGNSGPGAVNDISRPTESSALTQYVVNPQTGKGRWVAGKDPVRDQLEYVLGHLRRAALSVEQIDARMLNIAELATGAIDPPKCESCARVERDAPQHVFSSVRKGGVDLLDHPMRLCQFCYWHVYRKGGLPSVDVVKRHHDSRPIRVPATPVKKAKAKR